MIILKMMLSILIFSSDAGLPSIAQKHLELEEWEQAAEILDELVHQEETPSFEVLFDKGFAQYQLGAFEIAAKAFDDAIHATNDPMNKTYSAFNKGNAIYRQTMESLEGTGTSAPTGDALIELKDAKSQINQVLESYRHAIKNDPKDLDARANAELAWQVLKMLDQMQEQMEEQMEEKQQQEQAENQEQDQEEQDQSGEQSQQDHQGGSDSKQDQSGEQQQGDQQSDSDESEESKNQEPQETQQSQQPQDSQNPNQQETQQPENSEDSQNQDQQGGNEAPDSQDSHEKEQQESEDSMQEGELESIQEAMNKAMEQQLSQPKAGNRLSKEEASRLLQLIRDKEKARRAMLAARRAKNRTPVLRDW